MTARSTHAGSDPAAGPAGPVTERLEAALRVAGPPAVEARPADPELEGRRDALLPRHTDASRPEPEAGEVQ